MYTHMNNDTQNLKNLLKQKVLKVNFLKKDKTERVMRCTLRHDILPQTNTSNEVNISVQKPRKVNDNILSVWDLDKDAFRSFRLDSLISYNIVEDGYEL